jgi:thioredoxin-related protein
MEHMRRMINMMILLIGIISTVKAQGILFEENLTWAQIKSKAKEESKYIFVDAYATWCGPCKAMSADVFTNKEVGDFINEKYIAVKIQMDRTAEDTESTKSRYSDAKSIEQQYKITGYPTLLFFSPEGKIVHRIVGYRDGVSLIKDANDALSSETQYYTLLDLYESGKRDSTFVKRLAIKADELGQTETANQISREFIRGLSDAELLKKENLLFTYRFTSSIKDRGFQIFLKQPDKASPVISENAVKRKVRAIVEKDEIEPFLKDSTKRNWSVIERHIKSKYDAIGLESFYGARMAYASDRKDWGNFGKYYALYYNTAYTRSKFHINNISWSIFEYVADPKVLEVAIKTMKYNIDNYDKKDCQAYDTYANLLYKASKKQEAIQWEEKAEQIENERALKDNRKPDPVFAETLEKMKKGIKTWVEHEIK